jgi:hypothetical protein
MVVVQSLFHRRGKDVVDLLLGEAERWDTWNMLSMMTLSPSYLPP